MVAANEYDFSGLKVALVHYWLVASRGGEKVLEAMCRIFPQADIFTHVYNPKAVSETIRSHGVRTTFIQKLPWARKLYQKYLPLMPMALEQLDLSGYDLVISSESGPAKGVLTGPDTLHLCYCHTPMRYLWDLYHEYRAGAGFLTRLAMSAGFSRLRLWDQASAQRVDGFAVNSKNVAKRVKKLYKRNSRVIYPPVATKDFRPAPERGDHYLFVGQLVGYKRADLAVEAFSRLGKKLIVVGEGKELKRLRKIAGETVTFLGRQSFEVIREQYSRCRALIFPANEDFGIVPVEAMASGAPVIAFGKGGALETVVEGKTGLFFPEQSVESLIHAVERFEEREREFDPQVLREHAAAFDETVFMRAFSDFVGQELRER